MKHLIFLITLCILAIEAAPCDCEYQGSFLKVSQKSPFIALVKVTKYLSFKNINGSSTPMSMEVKISRILKGSEYRKKVTVWGDPGNLCRPYLDKFEVGQYYLIAFSPAGKYSYEKVSDYSISICGCYWLHVDKRKSIATGDINSSNKTSSSLSIAEIKSGIEKNGY